MKHPNDLDAKRLEKAFVSPVPDMVRNVVEQTRGGYILTETRPLRDSSRGEWTRTPVAKITFSGSSDIWKVYWMRASGKWSFYRECDSLAEVIATIREDVNRCFWG